MTTPNLGSQTFSAVLRAQIARHDEFVRTSGDALFSPRPRSGFTGELPLPVSGLMREGGLIGSL
jgi:hypothetical protein